MWTSADPWPGSPGGAASPYWSDYVRLFVRTAIAAGSPFQMGGPPVPSGPLLSEPFDDMAAWTGTATIVAGRTGTAMAVAGTNTATRTAGITPNSTVTFGVALKISTLTTARPVLQLRNAAAADLLTLQFNSGGSLSVLLGGLAGTVLGTSAAGVVGSGATYRYLEMRAVVADSGGSVVVRVNGAEVLNLAALDTAAAADTAVAALVLLGGNSGATITYDDMYMDTGTASVFRGPGTIPPGWAAARGGDLYPYDRLDAGNVMGGASPVLRAGTIDRLWVDVSCDVLDVTVTGGASAADGVFSKPDAATCTITLSDPTGKYDPLNPSGEFGYGGRSRLVPGTPVEVFAEVIVDPAATPTAVATFPLFTGTADSWSQDWTPHPWNRRTVLVATDAIKTFVRFDRPEVAAVGSGDTVTQRVHRIVDYYAWTGVVVDPPGGSTRTLQATTLAQSAWELLNRAWDDELGYGYVNPGGELQWVNRETWWTITPPVVVFGCDVPSGWDVLLDATPSALDRQMKNSVYAARVGGTTQAAMSTASIDRYGPYEYKRTDLGLASDPQVGQWVTDVLTLYAFPQITLDDVTFRLSIAAEPWTAYGEALGVNLASDIVHVHWSPPDRGDYVIDAYSRIVGYSHTITRAAWESTWQLVAAQSMQFAGVLFTMGPHANDRLDAGFVLGFAA